jgi:hypothetical protein
VGEVHRSVRDPVLARRITAISRKCEEDDKDLLEDDEPDEEDGVNHIAELTEAGWYRAQTTFAPEDVLEDYSVEDPAVCRLLHHTPIYYGPCSEEFLSCWDAPLGRLRRGVPREVGRR